jgi:hypothetical protein
LTKDRFERLVSIVSLCLALLALYLSAQANNIATKQSEAQVVVFNMAPESPSHDSSVDAKGFLKSSGVSCLYSMRLGNLTGGVTAITGYKFDVTSKYHADTIEVDSAGSPEASTAISQSGIMLSAANLLAHVTFPLQIDSYQSLDIVGSFTSHAIYLSPPPLEYIPEFVITFHTSSGKDVLSPKLTCTPSP